MLSLVRNSIKNLNNIHAKILVKDFHGAENELLLEIKYLKRVKIMLEKKEKLFLMSREAIKTDS